jgi:hypothetical protein
MKATKANPIGKQISKQIIETNDGLADVGSCAICMMVIRLNEVRGACNNQSFTQR